MKKYIILFFIVALEMNNNVNAQVQLVEGEIFGGTLFPTVEKTNIGAILGTEIRLNLANGKISPGMQLSVSGFEVKILDTYDNSIDHYGRRFLSFKGLCDYNFCPQSKIMPFVGLGIGFFGVTGDDWSNDFFVSIPVRVGCEFYKFLRLSLDYTPLKYDLSHFSLRLGFVIGGRNKK
jgi:hypothetical protein